MQGKTYLTQRWVVCPDCKGRRFVWSEVDERRCRSCSAKHTAAKKPKTPAGKLKVCKNCGEEFRARQEFHRYSRQFCSSRCAGEANHKRVVAGYPPREELERLYFEEGLTDRQIGRRFGHSHTWTLNVRKHYGIRGKTAKELRGKPLHKRAESRRWMISLKPADACRNCDAEGVVLHLHHAVPRSLNPAGKFDFRNGIQLCHRCHTGWHSGGVNVYRDVFTDDEWAFVETLIGPSWLDKRYPPRPADGGTLRTEWCNRGHRFTEENTAYLASGKRRCRACARENARRHREAREAETCPHCGRSYRYLAAHLKAQHPRAA